MTPSEKYPIELYLMTKNRCYKANKRRTPTGVQVHSVGCKGTNRDRWRRWNNGTIKKCASAFIDTNGIMQCLDWDVRPWLSGSGKKGNANDTHVGFEMCEPAKSKDTPEAAAYLYGCALYLCTELCRDYGISPGNVRCHCELHRLGLASNHADVNHWWGKSGTSWEPYTMDKLRRDVANALNVPLYDETGGIINMSVMKKGSRGEEVALLQKNLNALGFPCGNADGKYGDQTAEAVKAFQKKHGLTVDGKAGPITLAAIQRALDGTSNAGAGTGNAEPEQPSGGSSMIATELDILDAKLKDIEREVSAIREQINTLRNAGDSQ